MSLSKLKIASIAAFVWVLAVQLSAQDSTSRGFFFPEQNQAGARFGGWANLGEDPPRLLVNGPSSLETDFNSGSFYIEGFYGHRFVPWLMGEVTIGVVNRGDVTVNQGSESFYGNLLIYPITLRARVYPIGRGIGSIFPYLTAGGGLFHARHDIQFYQSAYYYDEFQESSETKFSYVLGGGLDIPLASVIGLEAAALYMPITFSDPIILVQDYDALTITIGVKYLFSTGKKASADRSRRGR